MEPKMDARICAETKSMSMQSCQHLRIFSPKEIHDQLGRARVPLVPLRIRGVLGGTAVSRVLPVQLQTSRAGALLTRRRTAGHGWGCSTQTPQRSGKGQPEN